MKYKNILVFDFETTGFSPFYDEIIEIGAVLLQKNAAGDYDKVKDLSVLVKYEQKLPEKIVQITNITDQMLAEEGVDREIAYQLFYKMYTPETLLIAYNIQFDIRFMQALFQKMGDPRFEIKNDLLDAMAVYKDFHKYPHRLESALEDYPVGIPNSHRAHDDAYATYLMLKKMQQVFKVRDNFVLDLERYVNIIGYNPKYPVKQNERLRHITYVPQYPNQQIIYKLGNKKR